MKRSAWRYLWTSRDIRRKILFTILILAIFRLASHVPVPGVNREAIAGILAGGGAGGTLVNLLDLLSGGTVSNFSVLAMGVYPYITAQIILQLLVPIIPALQRKMEEDQREGQKWMEKWTYILAVPMAALQAVGQINLFSAFAGGEQILNNFGFKGANLLPSLAIVFSMTAGTMFAIWLGELISEYGIRNQGLSLIIFAGIVARVPANLARLMSDEQNRWFILIFLAVITTLIIFAIVFVQQGRRNVPVMYPGRRVGNRMSMPVKGTLPLMVNMAGMIPLIFAQSILTFPAIIASFFIGSSVSWLSSTATTVQNLFGGNSTFYWIVYFLMVVAFTFFYTDVLFSQQNYGENLKKVGAQIPGVSRGAPTQKYLTRVLRRITFPGALFLGIVAILPWLIGLIVPFGQSSGLLLVSSAGLLIVVGVVRDTFFNIEAELKLHGYDDALLVR
ncbi:MAG: preprotein translocase subunit SecY [Anaerolineales bacterium]|nr:preprotein translocase subunit SecY [Anaerolineales bacterium]MDD5467833.1 preprotein translocase subunit SecY [Anaerolineales bacterium]